MLKYFTISLIILVCAICLAQSKTLWECNYCHQQYFGDNPPRFVKCPAKDNKTNHWWIKK